MGNRLSKIYTRTGDDGTTGLGDGTRVSKDDLRVEAFGTVDELNAALGLALTSQLPQAVRLILEPIQHELFDLGGELCIPGRKAIQDEHVTRLEQSLDKLNESLAPLKEFVLPGGGLPAALLHVARTVCRRAERCVIRLSRDEAVNSSSIKYLNRLSDLLFVTARYTNTTTGVPEILWKPTTKS